VEDTVEQEDELLLMAHVDVKQQKEDEWFLDSGCTNHMMGKGSVELNINGVVYVISHVYYVPELKNILLSVGQLQEKGLTILIKEGKCEVYHPERGQIMEIKMKENRMFVLTTTMISTKSSLSSKNGHLTYNGLRTLSSKKLDDKSRQCVLLGVSDESKAYHLFDPVNKKVLISKDVIFEEQKGWNWEHNEEYQHGILDWGGDEEYMSDTEEQSEENVVDHNDDQEIEEQNEEDVIDNYIGTNAPPNNYETPVEGRVRRNRREPV